MLRIFGRSWPAVCGFVLCYFVAHGQADGQFARVLNIPPDPIIDDRHTIFSDTQLNLFDGGAIGDGFDAGDPRGVNSNIEVNVFGGVVGNNFEAYDGSRVSIFGGSWGNGYKAKSGSKLKITGGEFRLDGELVEGLNTVGNRVAVNPPDGAVLSGTLADGTPFAFSSRDSDRYFLADTFDDGTLTLEAAELPDVGPAVISLPGDPAPPGIRAGQTVVVGFSGFLPDNSNAGRGSTVDVRFNGYVGKNLEAVDATVYVSGGHVGYGFDAFGNSVVDITQGMVGGGLEAHEGSIVNISGGSVGHVLTARGGSVVNVSGGSVGPSFFAYDGATVNITGGRVGERFGAFDGSTVNISGGSVGDHFAAHRGSEVNIFGTQFVLDGVDITESLTLNETVTIDEREVTLNGLLADGSDFAFEMNFNRDVIHPAAILTVTFVPALLPGDTDADGDIDIDDLNHARNNFAATGPDDGTLPGDAYPFDGRVDIEDLNAVRNNFGAVPATVPEPAAGWLTLLAVVSLAPQARRSWWVR